MLIRRAQEKDMEGINNLLYQVLMVHHYGRPDLFKPGGKKYKDDEELKANNPFKVYYFPTDGNPYEMQYRKDGNFSNEFGKGFYDEANNLLFEII